MPGGSRKSHSKSRNGCSQCKRRRKRCDQKPPRCSNCEKWGIVCDYTALSQAIQQIQNRVFEPPADSRVFSASAMGAPWIDPQEFELLHHYATVASFTLSTKSTLPIWTTAVPEEAKMHQFLMHSVLALSALHLSYVDVNNKDEHVFYANKQHENALASFRSTVGSIDCGNGNAVMAFSFLTVVFSVGLPLVYGFARTHVPTTAFIQIMHVLRGAHSAARPILPGVKKGALGPLIEIRQQQGRDKSCPMHQRGREVLDGLYNYIDTCDESEEYKPIYRAAVTSLYNFLRSMADAPPSWANFLSWPVSVSPEFFRLLQEERPFPLIILATWCVGLWRSPNLWFNAWSKRIVYNIYHQLQGEAKEAVRWPAEQVGVIPLHLHQQPCLCLGCRSCVDCQEESSEYHRPRHVDHSVEYLPASFTARNTLPNGRKTIVAYRIIGEGPSS